MLSETSSGDFAVRIRGIAKAYTIQHNQPRHTSLTEAIMERVRHPLRRTQQETFWALRDISFDVPHGEIVGIIGRNGAGKSTLLKILSRIAPPTRGEVLLRGRVGSLLEVGSGFHRELTGRENIFLNGSILGMKRAEILQQFDAIVDFAGVEAFLDTPVKRYSSGMYMRLAFGVAAHLRSEILIVDEVLAVGDMDFQKKCLGKMKDLAISGRTVLFVSHNMGVLQMLCRRGILLKDGKVAVDAPVNEAVADYLNQMEQISRQDLMTRTDRRGQGKSRICGIDVSANGMGTGILRTGDVAHFTIYISRHLLGLTCAFTIYDAHGYAVTSFNSAVPSLEDQPAQEIGCAFACDVDSLTLRPGRYRLNAALSTGGDLQDHLEGACTFDVEPGQVLGRPVDAAMGYGAVSLAHRWRLPAK